MLWIIYVIDNILKQPPPNIICCRLEREWRKIGPLTLQPYLCDPSSQLLRHVRYTKSGSRASFNPSLAVELCFTGILSRCFSTAMEYHAFPTGATQGWTLLTFVATLLLSWFFYIRNSKRPYAGIPVLSADRNEYLQSGRELLERGGQRYTSCFQVQTGTNWKIVVPNRFAQELKNHPNLSFNDAHARDSFTSYPGLEPFREILMNDTFIQEVVRKKLTQSLGLITAGMCVVYSPNNWNLCTLTNGICG